MVGIPGQLPTSEQLAPPWKIASQAPSLNERSYMCDRGSECGTCPGDCKTPKPKGATKKVWVANSSLTAAMYANGKGTSFSLSIITANIARMMSGIFGHFTAYEDDSGYLCINTGMMRVRPMLTAGPACKQPCDCKHEGECAASA